MSNTSPVKHLLGPVELLFSTFMVEKYQCKALDFAEDVVEPVDVEDDAGVGAGAVGGGARLPAPRRDAPQQVLLLPGYATHQRTTRVALKTQGTLKPSSTRFFQVNARGYVSA